MSVPVVHRRHAVPAALSRLAQAQDLVVTREQCLALGLNRHTVTRLVGEGSWRRLASGTYFTAPLEPPWTAWAQGGVLLAGDRARLGGEAAAFLHGLLDQPPPAIRVLLPRASDYPTVAGPWQFRRLTLDTYRSAVVGNPARLSVEDSVLDLVNTAESEGGVVHWVTTAVQRRRTTPVRLATTLETWPRIRHRRLLMDLLTATAAGAHSPLEVRYLNDVERAHGLPTGTRQVRRRNTVADVLYEEFGLLVELDGRLGHSGTDRFRDMWRDNVAAVDGLTTLRYGFRDVVDRPCDVASQVAHLLRDRGWRGLWQPCRRCRRAA